VQEINSVIAITATHKSKSTATPQQISVQQSGPSAKSRFGAVPNMPLKLISCQPDGERDGRGAFVRKIFPRTAQRCDEISGRAMVITAPMNRKPLRRPILNNSLRQQPPRLELCFRMFHPPD
jgi:hypothetical protein